MKEMATELADLKVVATDLIDLKETVSSPAHPNKFSLSNNTSYKRSRDNTTRWYAKYNLTTRVACYNVASYYTYM